MNTLVMIASRTRTQSSTNQSTDTLRSLVSKFGVDALLIVNNAVPLRSNMTFRRQ